MNIARKLWIGLGMLIFLSPLGLILPAKLGGGSAWGEWSADELHRLVGYLPAGFARAAVLWHPPAPDYALPGRANGPLATQSASYMLSAVIGVAAVVALTLLFGRLLARRGDPDPS